MAQNHGKIHTLVLTLILLGLGGLLYALTRIGAEPGDEPAEVRAAAPEYVERSATAVVAPEAALVRQSAGGETELAVEVLDPEGASNLRARIEVTGPEGAAMPARLAPASWVGIAPGRWTVRVTAGDLLPELRTLEVKAGERCTLEVTQRHGVRVRGRIANMGGEPAPNRTIWFLREGQEGPSRAKRSGKAGEFASANSRADGTFESPLLEPGIVRLLVVNSDRRARPYESTQFLKAGEDRELDVVLPGGGKIAVQVLNFTHEKERGRPSISLLAQSTSTADRDARRLARPRPATWVLGQRLPIPDNGLVTFSDAKPGTEYKIQIRSLRTVYTSEATFRFRQDTSCLVTTTMPASPPEVANSRDGQVDKRQARQAMPPPLDIQVEERLATATGSGPGIHWR